MSGLLRCSRYSFSPNKLKYCGPDKNQELAGYLKTKKSDLGLEMILKEFRAMEPYLKLIAQENGIADTFDEKVVEAYWLGNELLEAVSLKSFFNHARPRLAKKDLKWFEVKLGQGAKPNHSFHVFNFWKRTGHLARMHTVETMDSCRISVGKIIASDRLGNTRFSVRQSRRATCSIVCDSSRRSVGSLARHLARVGSASACTEICIATDKLIYKNSRLELEPTIKKVQSLESGYKPGDLVTIHWNWVCEKINEKQRGNLEKYTDLALRLANLTV